MRLHSFIHAGNNWQQVHMDAHTRVFARTLILMFACARVCVYACMYLCACERIVRVWVQRYGNTVDSIVGEAAWN